MQKQCVACGGSLEEGYSSVGNLRSDARISGRAPTMTFIIPGAPTSANPLKAFAQGLSGESIDRVYPIRGTRCRDCGRLELFGEVETT